MIDYGDSVLMAGIVDSHVHVNEPGRTEWEGFVSATKAAIAGGVTTIADMPLNSSPVTTTLSALETKVASMPGKLWCDVGLLGGVIPGNETEIVAMTERGVLGFKCFLAHSGIDEFPHISEAQILSAMRDGFMKCAHPVVFMFHAESPAILDEASALVNSQKPLPYLKTQYSTFLTSRPPTAEEEAIDCVIRCCQTTGVRTHIVHLSAASALPRISLAKQMNTPISIETTPHYLFFTAEEIADNQTTFKCCPPIRPRENREKLWEGLMSDTIDTVGSDHSPCTYDLKKVEKGDFMEAWGGINSLQLGLSIVWTMARDRAFTLPRLSQKLSAAPAKLLTIDDQVGSIEVGKLANFVIWEPDAQFTVTREMLKMKNNITPYLGRTLYGKVTATILRGEVVYTEASDVSTEPKGRWLKPSWIGQ